jgi:hypothetical protein
VIEGLTIKSVWLWLGFLVALLHPIFVSVIGALPFVSPLFRLDDHAYFMNFWGTVVAAGWTVTLAIVACLRLSGVSVRAIGLQPPQPRILLLLIVAALAFTAAIKLMPVHVLAEKRPVLPSSLGLTPTVGSCCSSSRPPPLFVKRRYIAYSF